MEIKNDMHSSVKEQLHAFENIYQDASKFTFHTSTDIFIRFLRDRRLQKGLTYLTKKFQKEDIKNWKVLIICSGVGGEGIFFLNAGFKEVTVSDFSVNSIEIAKSLDKRLHTLVLNAENLTIEDSSYDLVVVQDGLHHLPRPALGFTEMLRVAKKAVVVIEPYESLVGEIIGTEWEEHEGAINFVFRWNKKMIEQTVKSYLLKNYTSIKTFRFWDHNVVIRKLVKFLPSSWKYYGVKMIYRILSIFNFCGNMMVSVVCK